MFILKLTKRIKILLIILIVAMTPLYINLYLRLIPVLDITGTRAFYGGATRIEMRLKNTAPMQVFVSSISIMAEGGRKVVIACFDKGMHYGTTITRDKDLKYVTSAAFKLADGVYGDGTTLYIPPHATAELIIMVADREAFKLGGRYGATITYGFAQLPVSASFTKEFLVEKAEREFPILKVYFTAWAEDGGYPARYDPHSEAAKMKHALDRYAAEYSVGFAITHGGDDLAKWNDGEGYDIAAFFCSHGTPWPHILNNKDIRHWVKEGRIAFSWHWTFEENATAMREVFGVYYTRDHGGTERRVIKVIAPPDSPFIKDVPEVFEIEVEQDTMILDAKSNPTVMVIAITTGGPYSNRPYFTVARYGEGWAIAFQTHQGDDNPVPIETLAYNALVEALKEYMKPTP